MKIRITKIQPSKFDQNLVFHSRTFDKQLSTQHLVIGRGQQLQSLYQNQIDTISVAHRSISRQHVSLTLPYYLSKSSTIINSMVVRNCLLFPKYFLKLGGIFTNIPSHLLLKIRQYCYPIQAIVITDLNSKFGLFRYANTIKIVDQCSKNTGSSDKILVVSKKQKTIFQIGNQNMEILQLTSRLSYSQMVKHQKQTNLQIDNIKFVYGFSLTNPQPTCSKYYTMIIKHYPQGQQTQNGSYCHICVSKKSGEQSNKILIGRHDQCHIKLQKSEISRKHAKIYIDKDQQWIIQDIHSTNGTWLKTNKIIYKIKQLQKNNITALQKYNTNNSHSNIQELQEQINDIEQQQTKLKSIIIKLGQVKFDLQFIGIHSLKNELFYQIQRLQNRQTKIQPQQSYTKILTQISGLYDDQSSKHQPSYQINNNQQPSDHQQIQWNIGIDQSFQLNQNNKNIYKQQPYKNTCINMNILGQILNQNFFYNQHHQLN